MTNFKLNPESPLIYLFKGNEHLLNYPKALNTLAEISNQPLSFEAIDNLFWTAASDISRIGDKISENKNQDAAKALIPYIGDMLVIHRNNPSSSSKGGLSAICSLWADNDVLYEAYENSVEQSPDFTLLDALEQSISNNYFDQQNSVAAMYAGFLRTSVNKAIVSQVLNNGVISRIAGVCNDQNGNDANTR